MKWKNTFLVGLYKCELSYTKGGDFHAKWTPDLPDRPLSAQEMDQYRSGRDSLMLEVGKELGGPVVVFET